MATRRVHRLRTSRPTAKESSVRKIFTCPYCHRRAFVCFACADAIAASKANDWADRNQELKPCRSADELVAMLAKELGLEVESC